MKIKVTLAAILLTLVFIQVHLDAQQPASTPTPAESNLVFRDPFKLILRTDEKHAYEQDFGKVPYVANGDVYLFVKDNFGVNLKLDGDKVTEVIYQPDIAKADVSFHFTQEKMDDGFMMMLTIKNNTKHRLYMNALMTVPGQTGIKQTSILPVEAGLSNFESWPHPIVQLVLRDLRFTKEITSTTKE